MRNVFPSTLTTDQSLSLVVANAADSRPACLDEGFFEQRLVDVDAATRQAGDVRVVAVSKISKVVESGCITFMVFARERSSVKGAEEVVGFWAERAEHGGEGVERIAVSELELDSVKEVTDGDVERGPANRFGDRVDVLARDDPEEFAR